MLIFQQPNLELIANCICGIVTIPVFRDVPRANFFEKFASHFRREVKRSQKRLWTTFSALKCFLNWRLTFKRIQQPSEYQTPKQSEHMTFQTHCCLVFKWPVHAIRQTIRILDVLDKTFFVSFSDHHCKTGPFDNWTGLNHSSTRLILWHLGHEIGF